MNTSDKQPRNNFQDIIIQLEIVAEDNQHPDIADIEEISREIVDQLRSSGYTIEPSYTGAKGNPLFDIIMHILNAVHSHEALIVAAFTFSSSILQVITKVRDRRDEKEKARREPLEIILEVKGKPIAIKTSDVHSATKLIELFQQTHSEVIKEVGSESDMKIKVRVPKKQRGHKR